jgi:hypothetical protein
MDKHDVDIRRKDWNRQHALLRRMLTSRRPDRRAIPLFLRQHAAVHSSRLAPGGFSFQDDALCGMTDVAMRQPAKGGGHSVVWILWHITRIEDVTMNLLVAESPQVLDRGGWRKRLGVSFIDVGNDMPERDLATLNRTMNIKPLLAYRLAVGRRTRQILPSISLDALWAPVTPEQKNRLVLERVIRRKAAWLIDYWCGRRKADLLLMPPTRHCMVHLNEIRLLRNRMAEFEP